MNTKLRILHLEDQDADAELVKHTLRKGNVNSEIVVVDTKAEFEIALQSFMPDLIISDHSLPSFNSLEALKLVNKSGQGIPFILVTGMVSEEFAVNVIKEGASDYVLKDRLQRLPSAINNALEKKRLENERQKHYAKVIELNESLERKVSERTAQLEEANKELEAFSYTVSHDLQSPLRSLCSFANILTNEYSDKLDGEGKEMLYFIDHSSKRMSALIRDLLHFSKLGKAPVLKNDVNMQELVSAVIEEMKYHTENIKAEITVHALNPIPCDAALIKQVWANLISNALKYSAQKENPAIKIGMQQIGPESIYYVSDNGAGFDMKYSDKLFTVFQRLHSAEEFEGTGVGLATVHRIITKHGGRIWADGKKNEGATFYFSLPRLTTTGSV